MALTLTKEQEAIKYWVRKQREDVEVIVDVLPGRGFNRKFLGSRYYWVAIEPSKKNISANKLKRKYNEIHQIDFRKASLYSLPIGDCLIMGSILNRMKKEDILKTIELARGRYRFVILVVKDRLFTYEERMRIFSDATYIHEGPREFIYFYE